MKLKNYNTNTITLIRALLALGFLLTLVFNDLDDLFPKEHLDKIKQHPSDIMFLNIFTWFDGIVLPYYISIISFIIIIIGIYPRVTCLIQAIITFSVFNSMLIIEGGDQISLVLSILLVPICIMDNRLNGWKENLNKESRSKILLINSNYANLFVKFQIAVIYFNAGVSKIFAPEWPNGTAVYYWFNDNVFGANTFFKNTAGIFFNNDISVTFINWGVIFFEIYLSIVFLLSKRNQSIAFVLGILFHFTIILFHGLPTFFLAMSSALILYLWELDKSIKENLFSIKNNLYQVLNFKKMIYEYL